MRAPRHELLIERGKAMRNAPTEAERKLWSKLRDRWLADAKFTRQFAVASYIADFACRAVGLIIELGGGAHEPVADALRDRNPLLAGYRVLRFPNAAVFNQLEWVLDTIAAEIRALTPPPGPLPNGEGEQVRALFSGK